MIGITEAQKMGNYPSAGKLREYFLEAEEKQKSKGSAEISQVKRKMESILAQETVYTTTWRKRVECVLRYWKFSKARGEYQEKRQKD